MKVRQYGCLLALSLLPIFTLADELVIDKVYHPYVDALEHEIEYRMLDIDSGDGKLWPQQIQQLSIGKALSPRWFGEIYLKGEKQKNSSFELETIDLEFVNQLTEQGEYAIDAGLLFEYENEFQKHVQEVKVALLLEKEIAKWSVTSNLGVLYEWGKSINNEFETSLALQTRYRYARAFEPGLELYVGQSTLGLGPVFQGRLSVGIRKSIHWEAGVIFGLKDETPDHTLRFLFEYEF